MATKMPRPRKVALRRRKSNSCDLKCFAPTLRTVFLVDSLLLNLLDGLGSGTDLMRMAWAVARILCL